MKKLVAGLDLHSNKVVIGIMDQGSYAALTEEQRISLYAFLRSGILYEQLILSVRGSFQANGDG